MNATRRTADVHPAWRELWALVCAMRPEGSPSAWIRKDTEEAMRAAMTAGWSYEDVARELWRLVWDANGEPNDLRQAARRPRAGTQNDPDTGKRGLALVMAELEKATARNQADPPERDTA